MIASRAPSTGVCSKQLRSRAGACSLFCVLEVERGGTGTSLKTTQSLCSVSSSAHNNRGNTRDNFLPAQLFALSVAMPPDGDVLCWFRSPSAGARSPGICLVSPETPVSFLHPSARSSASLPCTACRTVFYFLRIWLLLISFEASDFSCWKRQNWSPSSIFMILVNL